MQFLRVGRFIGSSVEGFRHNYVNFEFSKKPGMRSIIVDDEPKNISILRTLLEQFCPEVEVVGEATSAESAIPVINGLKPQLVFLDIEMPRGNAFDLLDQIRPVDFEIIFITAFNEYSLKAFRYSALDYLLKPVNIEELKQAVERASKRIDHKNVNDQIHNLFGNIKQTQPTLQKIALPEKDGSLIFLELNQITRFEAKRGYTLIFLNPALFYISARPIKEYEEILPEALFFRINNSHIINIAKVKKYHKGRGGEVELEDGTLIEVATRRKDEFLSRLEVL